MCFHLLSFFLKIVIINIIIIAVTKVTTHCRMLTETERLSLCDQLQIDVTLLSLQAFETEQQFNQQLRYCISECLR